MRDPGLFAPSLPGCSNVWKKQAYTNSRKPWDSQLMRATPSESNLANVMILCIGTTPAAQRVMIFRKLMIDSVNRASATLEGAAGKAINVAKVLKALGEHPVATGFLGGDRGASILALLQAKRIDSEFVIVSART